MLHVSQPKRPITTDILHRFANILFSGDHINNISLLACILSSFFSFFRSSNLLPMLQSQFHSLRQLSRASFRFYTHGVLSLVFPAPKLPVSRRTTLCIPIPKIQHSVICPVRTLQQHFKQFPAPSSSPAFLVRENSKIPSLSVAELRTAIKSLVSILHLDPRHYSTHSLRRGGATFAFASGLPSELIKHQGDWHSQAYEIYLTLPLQDCIRFC